MTFDAEFVSFSLFHCKEPVVVVIVGEFGCGFFGRSHQKRYQCHRGKYKGNIHEQCVFLFLGSHKQSVNEEL
jgi:hypothetical protein